MGRDPESRKTTSDTRPFIVIEAPGPLGGIVTLTAIEGGHGRTLVEAAWTQDGHSHRDSVEADTFEDAHILANEIADELAAGRAPDLARAPLSPPGIEAREIERKPGGALDPPAFVLGVLLAAITLVIAAQRFRRMRRRQRAIQEWKAAHPDQERPRDA